MQGVRRLEAFSDGVFAIAATVLVLEIKVPAHDADFLRALEALWPSFAAYLVSFVFIGLWWMSTHSVTTILARTDGSFLLLYLLLLITIAFVPFPTAALADRLQNGHQVELAAAFYGVCMVLPSLAGNAAIFYLTRRPALVRRPDILGRWWGWRAFVSVPNYAVAIALSFVATPLALIMYAVIPTIYAITFVTGVIPVGED